MDLISWIERFLWDTDEKIWHKCWKALVRLSTNAILNWSYYRESWGTFLCVCLIKHEHELNCHAHQCAPLMATWPAAADQLWSELIGISLCLQTWPTNRTGLQMVFLFRFKQLLFGINFFYCLVCVCVYVWGQCCLSWCGRSLLPPAQWLMKINVWFAG